VIMEFYLNPTPSFKKQVDLSVPPLGVLTGTEKERKEQKTAHDLRVSFIPDSKLLALHAACTHVAHMSGAGEKEDQVDRDAEMITVLAADGADSALLYDMLVPHRLISV
jgi:hypothetical protein